jgi:hypothetical protein
VEVVEPFRAMPSRPVQEPVKAEAEAPTPEPARGHVEAESAADGRSRWERILVGAWPWWRLVNGSCDHRVALMAVCVRRLLPVLVMRWSAT